MELKVLNHKGQETGKTIALEDAVFGIEPNQQAVYEDVRLYLAHQRQGTHKAKSRTEVAFSTRKLYRQKGTGNARVGDAKSGTRRKGGTMHGPQPRDYDFKLNKKVRRLARRSALSQKVRENAVLVLEGFGLEKPRTKGFLDVLGNLKLNERKVLVLTTQHDPVVFLSGRNLPGVSVLEAGNVHTYHILHADALVLEPGAVAVLNQQLLKS